MKMIWMKMMRWKRFVRDVAWRGVNGKGTTAKVCLRMERPIAVRTVPTASIAPVQHKGSDESDVSSRESGIMIVMRIYDNPSSAHRHPSRSPQLRRASTLEHHSPS